MSGLALNTSSSLLLTFKTNLSFRVRRLLNRTETFLITPQIFRERRDHFFTMAGRGDNFSDHPAAQTRDVQKKQLEFVLIMVDLHSVGVFRARQIIRDLNLLFVFPLIHKFILYLNFFAYYNLFWKKLQGEITSALVMFLFYRFPLGQGKEKIDVLLVADQGNKNFFVCFCRQDVKL